jgi:hypothetical protein
MTKDTIWSHTLFPYSYLCLVLTEWQSITSHAHNSYLVLDTYLRAKETRCENGFSQAYIFITWMPTIISFINLIRWSVLFAVRRRNVDVILPKKAKKKSKKCRFTDQDTCLWNNIALLNTVYRIDRKNHISRTMMQFLSWKILSKIPLHLIVQRCITMAFKATEIPAFAGGIIVVVICGGTETKLRCCLH